MRRPFRLTTFLLTMLTVALVGWTATGHAQSNQPAERFTAIAVNMSGVGPGGSGTVDIIINRWSSDAERDRLLSVFQQKGPEKLLDALQDTRPVGYIRTPTSLGWDLRFARQHPDPEGGQHIIVVTDRPIGFAEAANRPRTLDYPFTVIEMHINKDGEGEGRASVATKITMNKDTNTVELENYSSSPVLLTKITREKS